MLSNFKLFHYLRHSQESEALRHRHEKEAKELLQWHRIDICCRRDEPCNADAPDPASCGIGQLACSMPAVVPVPPIPRHTCSLSSHRVGQGCVAMTTGSVVNGLGDSLVAARHNHQMVALSEGWTVNCGSLPPDSNGTGGGCEPTYGDCRPHDPHHSSHVDRQSDTESALLYTLSCQYPSMPQVVTQQPLLSIDSTNLLTMSHDRCRQQTLDVSQLTPAPVATPTHRQTAPASSHSKHWAPAN